MVAGAVGDGARGAAATRAATAAGPRYSMSVPATGCSSMHLAEFGVATGDRARCLPGVRRHPCHGRVLIRPFDASFQPGTPYDLILFLDVLEHLPDPVEALRHARSLLAPGGTVLVTVPAFRALWTAHDDFNHHRTRYTRHGLLVGDDAGRSGAGGELLLLHWVAPVKLAVRLAEAICPRAAQAGDGASCPGQRDALSRLPPRGTHPDTNEAALRQLRMRGRHGLTGRVMIAPRATPPTVSRSTPDRTAAPRRPPGSTA